MRDFKSLTDFNNVAFISTRIAGTDGVSLEIEKWAEVFEQGRFWMLSILPENWIGRRNNPISSLKRILPTPTSKMFIYGHSGQPNAIVQYPKRHISWQLN